MNKQSLSYLILALQIVVSGVLVYLSTVLPQRPSPNPLQTGELILLLVLYLSLGWNLTLIWGKLGGKSIARNGFTIFILSGALLLGFQISHPLYGAREFAADYTSSRQAAITTGTQIADRVLDQQLTPESAKQEIADKFIPGSDERKFAEQALELKLSGKPTPQISQELVPTIPLQLGKWTCVDIGCSFADPEFTWTIKTQTRYIGAAFIAITLLLIVATANQLTLRDLQQRLAASKK